MRTAAPATKAAIEGLLTERPRPAKAIWRDLDCWGLIYVKRLLDQLVAEGRAMRINEQNLPGHVHTRHLYSLPAA